MTFVQPRPYLISDRILPLRLSQGFGMPSGHAAASVASFGTLAPIIKKTYFYIIGAIPILFVCLCRIYYGVHSLSQVLAGGILAFGILFIISKFEVRFVNWFKMKAIWQQCFFCLSVVVLMFGINLIVHSEVKNNFQVPENWQINF